MTYRLFASPYPHFLVGCHHHYDDDHDAGDDLYIIGAVCVSVSKSHYLLFAPPPPFSQFLFTIFFSIIFPKQIFPQKNF